MANTIDTVTPTRAQAFMKHWPNLIDNTVGYVGTLGLNEPPCGGGLANEFTDFFQAENEAVNLACADYRIDFLIKNNQSVFPSWYLVERRLRFLVGEENMPDYGRYGGQNFWKDAASWDHIDHVCGFIFRLQKLRMDREVASPTDLAVWNRSIIWGACYLLHHLLQVFHEESQNPTMNEDPKVLDAVVAARAKQNAVNMFSRAKQQSWSLRSLFRRLM